MPFLFIASVVLLIIGFIVTVVRIRLNAAVTPQEEKPVRQDGEDKYEFRLRVEEWNDARHHNHTMTIPGFVPAIIFGLVALFLIVSSLTMVGTKNYGVVTTFGKPSSSTLDAGFHFKAPWQKVTDIDATIQPDSYAGKEGCIDIRIGNGSIACIDTTIRWRIEGSKANELFQDYRNKDNVTESVREALVKRELNGALNEVFGSYDPLAAVKGGENVTVDSLSSDVEEAMRGRVSKLGRNGPQVEVLSVTTPLITLDVNTQEKIDQFQSQVALTRIAEEKELTNKAEAKANAAIVTSITNPLVLANKCLGIMETLAKNGGVPAGLYCFPGGNGPVVVPGTGTAAPQN